MLEESGLKANASSIRLVGIPLVRRAVPFQCLEQVVEARVSGPA